MKDKNYPVGGAVKIFPVDNPWIYISIPKQYTEMLKSYADRGLVAVRVTLRNSSWNISLMPMGDGTQFIPLSAKVRKAENIKVGDNIELSFVLRDRKK